MTESRTLRKVGASITLVVNLPEGVYVRPVFGSDECDYEVVVDPAFYERKQNTAPAVDGITIPV